MRWGRNSETSPANPQLPRPDQTLVHVFPDDHIVGLHFAADVGAVCDPELFARELAGIVRRQTAGGRVRFASELREIYQRIAAWPQPELGDGVPFVKVVEKMAAVAPADTVVCLDAGTFAAPVYRHFPFVYPQRLMSPLSGAMGYGMPAAVASKLRLPDRTVICMVGDGGFLMTGNEIIAAAERNLPQSCSSFLTTTATAPFGCIKTGPILDGTLAQRTTANAGTPSSPPQLMTSQTPTNA